MGGAAGERGTLTRGRVGRGLRARLEPAPGPPALREAVARILAVPSHPCAACGADSPPPASSHFRVWRCVGWICAGSAAWLSAEGILACRRRWRGSPQICGQRQGRRVCSRRRCWRLPAAATATSPTTVDPATHAQGRPPGQAAGPVPATPSEEGRPVERTGQGRRRDGQHPRRPDRFRRTRHHLRTGQDRSRRGEHRAVRPVDPQPRPPTAPAASWPPS